MGCFSFSRYALDEDAGRGACAFPLPWEGRPDGELYGEAAAAAAAAAHKGMRRGGKAGKAAAVRAAVKNSSAATGAPGAMAAAPAPEAPASVPSVPSALSAKPCDDHDGLLLPSLRTGAADEPSPGPGGAERCSARASVVLRRSCAVLTHEVGHLFGLKHCIFFDCLMNGSNSSEESERRSLHLCPVCLRKLHASLAFDPVARAGSLAAACDGLGWRADADWGRAWIAAASGTA